MSALISKLSRSLSFAHLAGVRGARADNDGQDVDDDGKRYPGADKDDGDAKKSKRARRAEDERDDVDARGDGSDPDDDGAGGDQADSDDGDEDDDGDKKGKRAKRAKRARRADSEGDEEDAGNGDDDGEDDDDEIEMRGNSSAARARRREQARCAAIFASKAAARNPALAANLAFKTRMTRSEAIAVLEGTPGGAVAHVARRNPAVSSGGEQAPNTAQAIASSWDRAFAKVTPRR